MNTNSHTYTVIVEPMSNAFSAILKFDPDAWIEFEEGDEVAETYTINSAHDLSAVIEAAPGLITWSDQKVHGYSVSVNLNGFRSEEAHEYVRQNGGEVQDYKIFNHDENGIAYYAKFDASAKEFDTLREAEEFCQAFYDTHIPSDDFPVDPEAPSYYRNALAISALRDWSDTQP